MRMHKGLDFLIASDMIFVLLDIVHVERPPIVTAQVPKQSAPYMIHYVFDDDFVTVLTLLQSPAHHHL